MRTLIHTCAVSVIVAAFLCSIVPCESVSQSSALSVRTVGLHWNELVPRVSFSVSDLVSARVRRSLNSGLRKVILVNVSAHVQGVTRPVATSSLDCQVMYDLWNEGYLVSSSARNSVWVRSFDGVVRQCLVATQLPIGNPSAYRPFRGRKMQVQVTARFHPLTQDMERQMRRWLSKSTDNAQSTVFGLFVARFFNPKTTVAEREVRFQSQWVTVP